MDIEIKTEAEAVDWPAVFAEVPNLSGMAWTEVRPGFWQADAEPPGFVAVAAVCPTERQCVGSLVPAGLPPHQLAQLSFTLHDAIAERLRAVGWRVGCAGPGCEALWPCPKREMHDFMGMRNDGQLHTPIGLEKTDG